MKKTEDILATIGATLIVVLFGYTSFASSDIEIKQIDIQAQNEAEAVRELQNFQFQDTPTTYMLKDTEIADILEDNMHASTVKQKMHTIRKGDTIYSIGRQYKLNPIKLMKINKCGKCNTLKIGQKITLDFN